MPNVTPGSWMPDDGAVAVSNDASVARIVGAHVQPLTGEPSDFDELLELVAARRPCSTSSWISGRPRTFTRAETEE